MSVRPYSGKLHAKLKTEMTSMVLFYCVLYTISKLLKKIKRELSLRQAIWPGTEHHVTAHQVGV